MDQRWYTTIAGTGAEESQYGRTKYSGMCVMGSETDGGTALEKSVQGLQHKSLLQIPVRGHHPPAQITAPEILWVPVVSACSPHTLSTLFLAACSPGCALHPPAPLCRLPQSSPDVCRRAGSRGAEPAALSPPRRSRAPPEAVPVPGLALLSIPTSGLPTIPGSGLTVSRAREYSRDLS